MHKIWIKQQLEDYGVVTEWVSIFYDDTVLQTRKRTSSSQEGKAYWCEISFFRDNVEKDHISMEFCYTKEQITDIFIKGLSRDYFERKLLTFCLIKMDEHILDSLNDWIFNSILLIKKYARMA